MVSLQAVAKFKRVEAKVEVSLLIMTLTATVIASSERGNYKQDT